MPTLTITYQDAAERLALEQAIAFFSQLRQVAQMAPAGTALAAGEPVALRDGRALLRNGLAAAAQARIDQGEQKGGRPAVAPAHAATPARHGGGTAVTS